jgi:hypothetical protein
MGVVTVSYNGSGTFQINTSGQPVVAGTVISSTAFNALTADLATGLSTAITKDGQTTTTARIIFAQGTRDNTLTASSAVATDASKNLVSVTNTGTGNNVLATSPTLVTPALGTPASGIMTNVTGINYDGFKNRIINGAMVIDQRNAGASVTNINGAAFSVDRWNTLGTVVSKFTAQQNAGSVTPPDGFVKYLGATSLSAYTVSSGDYFYLRQTIEGFNIADLGWGTANAKTVTLSFWVRSSLTGTFGGGLNNSAFNRSYPFSFTISSANTWEQKTINIAGDTTGTWLTTNGLGISLSFGLGVGSTGSGTANAWAAGNFSSVTGATSVVGTSGATFYITGVQLEKGSTATSFDYRPYGTELALCQRYFSSTFPIGTAPAQNSSATGGITTFYIAASGSVTSWFYPVTMRASPTVVFYNPLGANSNWYLNNGATETSSAYSTSATSTSPYFTSGATVSNQYARIHASASIEL